MDQRVVRYIRLAPVAALALAISLPIALISIAKLLVLLAGGVVAYLYLADAATSNKLKTVFSNTTITNKLIILSVLLFITSSLWSSAPTNEIIKSINLHGNLLIIPLLAILIKSKAEAIFTLKIYLCGQLFLLISSWLIFLGVQLPWAIATVQKYAVFSSELDQSIMTGIFAALVWNFRSELPEKLSKYTWIPALLALVCVFYIFEGRTGHVVALALLTLAIFWELPKKLKFAALIAPIFIILIIGSTSSILHDRFSKVKTEIQAYSQTRDASTSTGTRLDFWTSAIQIIEKHPAMGAGVGSWPQAYRELPQNSKVPAFSGNPHQEYLLWGVEIGVGGIVLLCAIFLSILFASFKMDQVAMRGTQSVLAASAIACLFNCALLDALIGDHLCFLMGLMLNIYSNKKLHSNH